MLNALYRPGPLQSGMADVYVNRKLGREKVSFIFPELEEILKDTYGIIVFQEQVMQISVRIANFSMSEADEMRKIMGKKDVSKMPAQEKKFLERAAKKGYDKKKVEELFGQMKTFAEYGFNKSHATAYAYLAYQTAYLKAHYPVYFMSAHLSSEADKTSTSSKIIQYISESKKMGIDILPPDINKSREHFHAESACAIRFGLIGLKNVGSAALGIMLAARDQGGEFKSFDDFVTRVDLGKVNHNVLESLIKAGAFDRFGLKRRSLFEGIGEVIKRAAIVSRNRSRNQMALFADEIADDYIPRECLKLEEWPEQRDDQGRKGDRRHLRHPQPPGKIQQRDQQGLQHHHPGHPELRVQGRGHQAGRRGHRIHAPHLEKRRRLRRDLFRGPDRAHQGALLQGPLGGPGKGAEGRRPLFPGGAQPFPRRRFRERGDQLYLENLQELEAMLKKKARKIVITINYDQIDEGFNEKLKQKLEKNRDSVPYMIVINHADNARVVINCRAGPGRPRHRLDEKRHRKADRPEFHRDPFLRKP